MYRVWIVLLFAACDDGMPRGGTPDGMPMMPDAASMMPDAAPQMVDVAFRYAPQWSGVTAVTVLGGFGQAGDWTQPLVTLANDGSGTFTGSTQLPAGQYPYVFHVTGDAAAATPATYARYSIDPANPQFVACPMQSPTFSMAAPNPCSLLDTSATAPTLYHVRGNATVDGAGASGWLAVLERDEMSSHHFFVNRATLGADGSYDLTVAPGQYRVQIQHPTFISMTDEQRNPLTLPALRRALSNAFMVSADHMLPAVEVAYHQYAQMVPQSPMASLPVNFGYSVPMGDMARAAVYGGSATNFREIGDPWFASPYATATGVQWTGAFNTMQATQTTAVTGQKYYWGTWLTRTPWTLQTMVFPLTLQ